MSHCPHYFTWIVTTNETDKRADFARARCKSWKCEYCAEVNRNIWVARMLYAVQVGGGEWSFVTLTAHEKTRTTAASRRNVGQGWNRLNLRLKRAFGALCWVRVYELTKKGSFHIHILISRQIPTRWWKDNARECGMGFQAKSKKMPLGDVRPVFYVAKYMTKEPEDFPKGVRRINCSRNFPDRDREKTGEWRSIGHDFLIQDLYEWTNGFRLEAWDIQEEKRITLDDWIDG